MERDFFSLRNRKGLSFPFFLSLFLLATAVSLPAQTFTTLVNFDGTNGSLPISALVQGTDGNFYGTAAHGGANNAPNCTNGQFVGCGTFFKVTLTGTLTTLYSFCAQTNCTDGASPSGLVLAGDGNFYGTTSLGGAGCGPPGGVSLCGTVFKISAQGILATLHSFNGADGTTPLGGLIQGTDGDFYGTTINGGANCCGTVFKITPGGTLTTLYSFSLGADGGDPNELVQGTDGNFYGTTTAGANRNCSGGCGTVFKITPGGTLTTLHSFSGADGGSPQAGLVQGTDGNFYGTTARGGANNDGTVFKITPGGTLTTLQSFNLFDFPRAPLVQATDGNFYGTTYFGGANCTGVGGCGTVFEITPTSTLTTLHSFCSQTSCADGSQPIGGLVQATNGNFYGTTTSSGTNGFGTIFNLSVGLGPFVKTEPTAGPVGTPVIILGNNLTGSTRVSFNGTAATFTVVSSSEIQTTVPVGATTGTVQVTLPSGTLNSNVPFRVTKPVDGDFDGDHKSDIAVWRPSNGTWFVIPSNTPSNFLVQQWGASGDIPVRGDYDGDGKTDFAVFRPSSGTWFIIPSSNPSAPIVQQWGTQGDIPVPGDYDGDGKTDFAVWRPSTGTWFIIPSSNPSAPIVRQWGTNGDIPVPGDYDGDGKTDFAVWRPSSGTWFIIPSSNPSAPIVRQWGTSGDLPVPGDYDGDGKADFAVWRPSSGTWFIIPSSNPSAPIVQQWGTVGDIPVPVDYDGDGKTDIAVWRPSNGVWYIIPSATPTNFTVTQWGTNGDVPVQKPIGQ